jgi:hypothetical protein
MSAPWPSLGPPSLLLGACGFGGLVYGAIVIRRARHQTDYTPVWQDWFWYMALPIVTYGTLAVAAVTLRTRTELATFIVGGVALGLLLIGIHNAWDTVTHIAVTSHARTDQSDRR